MSYLLAPSSPIMNDASQAVQPCLLVWGRIRNGELILEPAFQLNTRASLPARPGSYTLSGQADDGSSVFSLSFSPNAIADAANNQQNFAFAVPLSAARASRLSSIQIVGGGKRAIRSALPPLTGGAAASQAIQARRIAAGRVAVRWDSRTHPMVMVRDPDNGQVLSLARGGEVQVSTLKSRVELVISDGVRSRVTRMRIAQ
jgi:hypothetical protein